MRVFRAALPFAVLAVLGCSQSTNSPATIASVPAGSEDTHPLLLANSDTYSASQQTMGRYEISLDLEQMSATAQLKTDRTATANDDQFELSIENFVRSDSFTLDSFSNGASTIDIGYTVRHPFGAPTDLNGTPTAANRADLGVTGRVLFLLDVPGATGNTYFAGDSPIVANAGLITNADGYYSPGGLVDTSSLTADTFPYFTLVNEGADNRGNGITNGGDPLGNYDAGNGGWQQANIGGTNDGWTGYGMLHQGQEASGTVSIDRAALQAGSSFSFDSVIVVK